MPYAERERERDDSTVSRKKKEMETGGEAVERKNVKEDLGRDHFGRVKLMGEGGGEGKVIHGSSLMSPPYLQICIDRPCKGENG